MPLYLKGEFKKTIYSSPTGYIVGLFRVHDSSPEYSDFIDTTVTFTGYFAPLNDLDTYIFYGEFVTHSKYGKQFQVASYERSAPDTKDALLTFLTSGLFKGIGTKKAQKLIDTLGPKALDIILENPNDLLLIPTITSANVNTLHTKLKEYESSYETILYLTDLGFNMKDAMLIYNRYKEETKTILDKDLYQPYYDINEISFKKLDRIALNKNLSETSPNRLKASIIYLLTTLSDTYGHSYFFYDEIITYLPRILYVTIGEEDIITALNSLEKDLLIKVVDDKYYLMTMYEAETSIVKRIRLLLNNDNSKKLNYIKDINILETEFNIKYNAEQKSAIASAMNNNILIITGGPGTGKTTIMRAIVEMYRKLNKLSNEDLLNDLVLLAPTGRAAKRLSEATIFPASTIHRFLKWEKNSNKFQVNEYNKSKVKLVIVDESSMLDTYLMANLFKGISANCKLILVGDDKQLPSVGPGQVLRDLIESNLLPTISLAAFYRQGKDSHILELAYDIRKQVIDTSNFNKADDLTFIKCPPEEVINNIKKICSAYLDYDYNEFQVLAPIYKSLVGIDAINGELQKIFNPKDPTKKEILIGDVIFRVGDKVLELINMPDNNIYNGDIGIISKIVTSPNKEVYVDYDGNMVKYTPTTFLNFRLAYAISIHKSQGSEFDVVIIPLVNNYHKMLYQKLIYTAVTRTKKKLYLIGEVSALEQAVKNNASDIRRTTIKDYLINGLK